MDLARAAKSRGVTTRAMLGWTPTQTVTKTADGYQITTEPEWDATERAIALALDQIEAQTCSGCGGDLTVELTSKHPLEDDGDGHFHRAHVAWCRSCVAADRWHKEQAKDDELVENHPGARRVHFERLPIPKQ